METDIIVEGFQKAESQYSLCYTRLSVTVIAWYILTWLLKFQDGAMQ